MRIRSVAPADAERIRSLIVERWGDETVVGHGEVMRPHEHPGFIASDGEQWVGLVTYRFSGDSCEVVSIDALEEGRGIGSTLLLAVVDAAKAAGCRRLWLITTNDNARALAFYQRRGFRVIRIHEEAVDESRRRFKPSIPLVNTDTGLPIRDEVELERTIAGESGPRR